MQDAYLKAYEALPQYRGGSSAAWLLKIVRNTCLTMLRRRKGRSNVIVLRDTLSDDDPLLRTALRDVTSVPERQVIAKAEQEAVCAALADLPEHYREIVVLREFEDMSYQEIADVTQLPIGTVMSRLSRARRALREALIESGEGDEAASCEEVTDLLEPFADGGLALPDQEAVAQHVRGCTECQLHLEELRVFRGKLKRLPPFKAAAGLASRLAERLAEKREPARREAWSAWSMPVASHLAAALIGLAAGYWILLGAIQSDSLSRELVAAHVRSLMAAQPFDVASGDPHRVGPWFAGKLDFAPKVRDLAAQGFPLVGGRVDYFDGRRVAAIVFRRRDHVINVFIMPHGNGPMRHEELRRNDYNIESWSDGEYDFWAVSDLNRDELDMLTKLLGA